MQLTQIALRNFKAIRSADIRPSPLTVWIGRNNSGKSTILQALALLAQSADNPGQVIPSAGRVDLGIEPLNLTSLDANRSEGWTIQLTWEDYRPQSDPIGPGAPVVVGYELNVPGDAFPWSRVWVELQSPPPRKVTVSARSDSNEVLIIGDDLRSEQRTVPGFDGKQLIGSSQLWRYGLSASAVMPPFEIGAVADPQNAASRSYPMEVAGRYMGNGIANALTEFQYVGPSRQFLHAQLGLTQKVPSTIATAEDVAAAMAYRRELERRVSARCQKIFHYGVEIVNVPGNVAIAAVDKNDRTVNAVNMGSGFNQIAWMAAVLEDRLLARESTPTATAIVGVEEPELHLHPAAQSDVAELLRIYATAGVQIFTTTHSEHLLKALLRLVLKGELRADQIAVLYMEDGKPEPLPVDDWGRLSGGLKGFFDTNEQELTEHLDLLIEKGDSIPPQSG